MNSDEPRSANLAQTYLGKRQKPGGPHYLFRVLGFRTLPNSYTLYYVLVILEENSSTTLAAYGGSSNDNSKHRPTKRTMREWCIAKRYSQFYDFRNELLTIQRQVPPLPGKRYLGNRNPQFVLERARGLSTFVWMLASSPQLCDHFAVRRFLTANVCQMPSPTLMTPLSTGTTLPISATTIQGDGSSTNTEPKTRMMKLTNRSQSENALNLMDQRRVNDNTGIVGHDGRMVLTSVENLQQQFVEQGIILPEDDEISNERFGNRRTGQTIQQSENNDNDDDDIQDWEEISQSIPRMTVSEPSSSYKGCIWPEWLRTPAQSCRVDLGRIVRKHPKTSTLDEYQSGSDDETVIEEEDLHPKKLRIVIILVGSRGDVQPYVALGKGLINDGHTVRIAAHSCFRSFVTSHGLEFAPLAGDPKELLKMVTEHSMFSYTFVKEGITTHRKWVKDILYDAWDAATLPLECLRSDDEPSRSHNEPATPAERNRPSRTIGSRGPGHAFAARGSSFRADVIIANPPSFSGWHISEALGVPFFVSFPMPWSRTREFPSPFTTSVSANGPINWLSYGAVDRLIWLGTGDIINRWRQHALRLEPIWTLAARGHRPIHDNKVPHLYPWSASLLPKPSDWEDHLGITGYWFLESDQNNIDIDADLESFVSNGDPPVFIGFGSIVVNDPKRMASLLEGAILELLPEHRIILQRGWTEVQVSEDTIPGNLKNRFLAIGEANHRWLFPRCSAVVHHGGAGTTAEGLRAGKPTMVVPFFGDQFFWGRTVRKRKLGNCIPYSRLTSESLAKCIRELHSADVIAHARNAGETIRDENGVANAINFLYSRLPRKLDISFVPSLEFDSSSPNALFQGDQDDWQKWPYYNLHDAYGELRTRPGKAVNAIGKRVGVVGSAIASTVWPASQEVGTPAVELQEINAAALEPISETASNGEVQQDTDVLVYLNRHGHVSPKESE